MGRDLTMWNLGMADAESGSLAARGKSRDYYDGYDYACAVNYESIGPRQECSGEGDLPQIHHPTGALTPSRFTAQLDRLNSKLLESHGASPHAGNTISEATCVVVKKPNSRRS